MPLADSPPVRNRVLLIACGALAREILDVVRMNAWHHMSVTCLPAIWHNTPQKIPEALRAKIRAAKPKFDRIYVLYGDCGTGGELDRVIAEEEVERLEGAHCYAYYRGVELFQEEAESDPTCFYLTDYLVRHFERLIIQGMAIDRHPELLPMYFGNYTKLVYLAQTEDGALKAQAEEAAAKLGLEFVYRFTGYGEMGQFMAAAAEGRA